jgi:hypothetical protein
VFSQNQLNTQVVRIDTVDVNTNSIHCSSKDGGKLVLKIPVGNGFYRMPQSGEHWIVRRQDLTNWYFEGIIVGEGLYGSAYAKEGDGIINIPGNLNISANHIFLNNLPIGVWHLEEMDLEDVVNQIDLSHSPISEVTQVFHDSLLVAPSAYIIHEQSLIFPDGLAAGKVVIYYMRSPDK